MTVNELSPSLEEKENLKGKEENGDNMHETDENNVQIRRKNVIQTLILYGGFFTLVSTVIFS